MARYIDADELMEIFKILKWDASCSIVEDMPTADVVPMKFHERCMELEIKKRANMVEHKRGKNISEDGFLCSVCTFGDFGGFHGYEPNYCPNCGAKMDEREEEE